jgi:hypothetical protein
MALSLQNFGTTVANMAAAVQSSAAALLDLTVGSTLRAILEANASIVLWLQWLILRVLALTRAATSTGTDLDSWMADFSVSRLPGVQATGLVTFGRFTLSATLIPLGALVKTIDGTMIFTVIEDDTNPAWSAILQGYVLAIGVATLTVLVQSTVASSMGNVLAGTIGLLASAMPGVDTVTNALPFANGIDPETDAALRARFQLFLSTRSRATAGAIAYAISQVQQGLTWSITENWNGSAYTPGTFFVAVDDGSGDIGAPLLALITAAIQAVRPIGSVAIVVGASALLANVSMTIVCASTALHAAAVGPVAAAINAFIEALPAGGPMPYSILSKLAYDASPNVTNVTGILLNTATADLTATNAQVIRAGTVVVN